MYAVTCVLLLVPLLFAARASALKYLQPAGKTIEARRDEVRRLWRRKHGHGGSGALIGGIGGAVALAAVGDTHMESVQTDKASRGGHGRRRRGGLRNWTRQITTGLSGSHATEAITPGVRAGARREGWLS